MISIQPLVRLCVVGFVVTLLPVGSSYADSSLFASSTGGGSTCTASQPCSSIGSALSSGLVSGGGNVRVRCLTPIFEPENFGFEIDNTITTLEIDCPQSTMNSLTLGALNIVTRLRGLTFGKTSFFGHIIFAGKGTLILEDCTFVDFPNTSLQIQPNGPLNLVIKNSRVSNNGSGILLKPVAGGSIKATFDHVVITGNTGGGIKADSTNGVVNLDITDSEISNNGGNGLNAIGAGASQNMLNLSRTVIAKNGVAGLQANGANAAALVDTTLFDTNTNGATSAVGGGHILTYGNNRIVGSPGSGFTGSAALQ
jgi:hypothetical protein